MLIFLVVSSPAVIPPPPVASRRPSPDPAFKGGVFFIDTWSNTLKIIFGFFAPQRISTTNRRNQMNTKMAAKLAREACLQEALADPLLHFRCDPLRADTPPIALIGSFPKEKDAEIPLWVAEARCFLRRFGYAGNIICPINKPGNRRDDAYWVRDPLREARLTIVWFDCSSILETESALLLMGQALGSKSHLIFLGTEEGHRFTPITDNLLKARNIEVSHSLQVICQRAAGQRVPQEL